MSACAHPVTSVLANVYADVHNTRLTYTPAHAWCPKHRSTCMHTLRKKCICARACAHMQQCRSFFAMIAIARICNGAEASLPWKLLPTYLESCASIVQAVVCRPLLLPFLLSRRNPSPDAARSRNPSKSTLAHDAVAATVSHKHHSIIRVGAGLIQFVYRSQLRLATELIHHRNLFSSFPVHVRQIQMVLPKRINAVKLA